MRLIQFQVIIVLLGAAGIALGGPGSARGSFLVHEMSGEVSLSELGHAEFDMDARELPFGIRGRFHCRVDAGADILLSASNRMFLRLRGEGEFGVERFEQAYPVPSGWASGARESNASRMLLSFRSGHLFVDSRQSNDASRISVETPLGRISSGRALWQIRVDFDQRSGIFDFEIACSGGQIDFTDRRNMSYTLRPGQRLSGAGGWMNPGIEVVEMTGEDREYVEDFVRARDTAEPNAKRLELYQPFIERLETASADAASEPATPEIPREKRPVTIEYAPQAAPLTPFRAEIPAPRTREAEIF